MTRALWYVRLAEQWREHARTLDRYGALDQANALRACAAELVEAGDGWGLETLTLKEATEESGLSYSGLEKMVRDGRLENLGTKGSPRVRRGDLPRKESRPSTRQVLSSEPDLAGSILAARGG
jgi:hypothetical protein